MTKIEWDPSLEPFMIQLISKKGVKVKQAAEVGKRMVDYFRGHDFCKYIKRNWDTIKKRAPHALDNMDNFPEGDTKVAEKIAEKLIKGGFIVRAQYQPLTEEEDAVDKRPKWPKRLARTQNQQFDEASFYLLVWEGSKTLRYIALVALIVGVLLVCLFPAYPFWAKLGIWYVTVFLSAAVLLLVALRLLNFLLFWFVGYDFWVFPNLFDENATVIDSFIPLYSFEKRGDGWGMFAVRVSAAVLMAVSLYQLNQVHSVEEIGQFAKTSLLDILEWGEKNFAALPEPKGKKLPTLQQIEERLSEDNSTDVFGNYTASGEAAEESGTTGDVTDEWTCLTKCGYKDEAALHQNCIYSCACLADVVQSACFASCNKEVSDYIRDAHKDACEEEADRTAKKRKKKGGSGDL
eukprot:Platyproteum_vivax@DN6331_c0_g1_i1.p1